MNFLKSSSPLPPISAGNGIIKSNDVLDYNFFIDSGSPDSYLTSDVTNIFNNESLFNVSLNGNTSDLTNGTNYNDEALGEVIIMAITSLVLGLMILVTVIGNVFVIAAIILERNLQNVANYLVASLAVADLFVACLVMPLGAVYEISRGWILGPELCDIWTSCDVLCCTASILHLVAIATDRYWAVTNVDYMYSRTSYRIFTMIFLVWFASVIVSLAPQFGWKDPEYLERIEQQKCMVSQDVSYQVFATCCTFYVPLLVILVLYWKIYQTARRRIHRRRPKFPISANNNQDVPAKVKQPLRDRIKSKFTNTGRAAVSSLGLVEGHSTNTVNTVEDLEESSNAERKMIESTAFNSEGPAATKTPISTVSHNVANQITNQTPGPDENNQNLHFNNNQSVRISINNGATDGIDYQQPQPPIEPNENSTSSATTTSHNNQNNNPTTNQLAAVEPQSRVQQQQQQHLLTPAQANSANSTTNIVRKRKETLEAKRERKAAKTLAIITSAFVVCWAPFFFLALLLPLCETCYINDTIMSLFLWLGYFNSTLNPVIYTIFSPEFRQAFKRILCGSKRPTYSRGKL